MLPLISVIVPTFNRKDFLEETLTSILEQDYKNIELIIIDDGSSDGTSELLKAYANRARVVVQENRGETATVNGGFSLAKGKYVCVANSDDPLLPGCFSTLVPVLEANPDALVAYGDWAWINSAHDFICSEKLKKFTTENMLTEINFGLGPGTLIRKQAIDDYGPRTAAYRFAGDMEFFMRLSLHGRLLHVPKLLATHRIHKDSASLRANPAAIFGEMTDAFRRTLSNPALPSLLKSRRNWTLERLYGIGFESYSKTIIDKAHNLVGTAYYAAKYKMEILFKGAPRPSSFWKSQKRHAVPRNVEKPISSLPKFIRHLVQRALYMFCNRQVRLAAQRFQKAAPVPLGTKRPIFCFSSRFLPPLWSGGAVVIGRLLRNVPPEDYCLIGQPLSLPQSQEDYVGRLPAKYITLSPITPWPPFTLIQRIKPHLLARLLRPLEPLVILANFANGTIQRARQIVRAFHDPAKRPRVLIGCTGDYYDPPATWLAAKILGSKVCLYYFDDFHEQWWADPQIKRCIRIVESYIVPRTDFLIAPNEMMRDKIRMQFNRPCHIVRNPMPEDELPADVINFPANAPVYRLVFTGAIYHLNYGVFRAIIQAMRKISGAKIELHLYTAQPHELLRREGLTGEDVVLHPHAKPKEVVEAQRMADILLIPFSLEPACLELVRTSATAKLADYLATGRPILAIAMEDSYVSRFLRLNGAGVAAHTNNPDDIASAISKIISSPKLREQMHQRARDLALEEFTPSFNSGELVRIVRESAGL